MSLCGFRWPNQGADDEHSCYKDAEHRDAHGCSCSHELALDPNEYERRRLRELLAAEQAIWPS